MGNKLETARSLYMQGIRDGNAREAVTKYTGDRYTQHSTGVRDGVEGFVEFFEPFIERNPIREIEIVRGWEDGQYVFVHAYQSLNNGEWEWVTTDFFDTDENDKIIEHWDVIAPYSSSTPSGHTSTDGATEITDLDKTEENKALVRAMIKDVFMAGGDVSKIDAYFSAETYTQHNKDVADGLENLKTLVFADNDPLVYTDLHLIVGKGNFVATLCRVEFDAKPYAQVDIFRLEDGKIVEHWDNSEPIPPQETWVNSGKF